MAFLSAPMMEKFNAVKKKEIKKGNMMTTYTGAHGMADAKLRVSKKVFDSINDFTRLGRCCANSCAKKPPRDVP